MGKPSCWEDYIYVRAIAAGHLMRKSRASAMVEGRNFAINFDLFSCFLFFLISYFSPCGRKLVRAATTAAELWVLITWREI
jgi:hypothetical protein